jgi:Ubiquitin family
MKLTIQNTIPDAPDITVRIVPTFTISDIQDMLIEFHGYQPKKTKLVYNGRYLDKDQTIEELGIKPEETLTMVLI